MCDGVFCSLHGLNSHSAHNNLLLPKWALVRSAVTSVIVEDLCSGKWNQGALLNRQHWRRSKKEYTGLASCDAMLGSGRAVGGEHAWGLSAASESALCLGRHVGG